MSPTSSANPLCFLTDFRDDIKAVVNGANIAGMDSTDRVRAVAKPVDELLWLMKLRAAIEWPAIDLRLGRLLRSESEAV